MLVPGCVATTLHYIQDHYQDRLRLADLGRVGRRSPFHLQRLWKAYVGETPRAYQRRVRLLHAQRLLRHTHLPIRQVSREVGFGDQSHFTQVFRRHVGMTPRQYRDGHEAGLVAVVLEGERRLR
jgi:transcriptional regulator GlxA family with amidase domain